MVVATVLALSSAGLHATWNFILKAAPDEDRHVASWGQFLAAGLVALPVLAVVGLPGAVALPWLLLSCVIHMVYVAALVAAYGAGDLSLTYPLARGGGALVAALGGVALLGDHLALVAWVAICVVVAGLLSLVGRSSSRRAVGMAFLTALTIGGYTVVDAHAARLTSGASYGLTLMPLLAIALSVVGVTRGRGRALVRAAPGAWSRWAFAGACSAVAYTVVLIAVRSAPVGYVTMLRESSVVLGALAGWVLLHERLGARRLASSGVVLAGLLLLVVASV